VNTDGILLSPYRIFARKISMGNSQNISIDRLKKLDPETITAVHTLYYAEIFKYACYRLSDPVLAEDLTSEVLLRLIEAVNKGRGPQKSIKGWLMGTASNLINEHFRQSYNRPETELNEQFLEVDADPIHISEEKEEVRMLRLALAKLTEDQQNVIALRFGGGYSLEETASVMGKNVNAVKALQFRAVSALRRVLEKINHE